MKTKVTERPKDIQAEDGGVYIQQTESGSFYIRIGKNSFNNAIIVDRMELNALARASVWIKNEVDGKNK